MKILLSISKSLQWEYVIAIETNEYESDESRFQKYFRFSCYKIKITYLHALACGLHIFCTQYFDSSTYVDYGVDDSAL